MKFYRMSMSREMHVHSIIIVFPLVLLFNKISPVPKAFPACVSYQYLLCTACTCIIITVAPLAHKLMAVHVHVCTLYACCILYTWQIKGCELLCALITMYMYKYNVIWWWKFINIKCIVFFLCCRCSKTSLLQCYWMRPVESLQT